MTFANAFKNDARIKKAKEEILQVLEEHQKKITGIKPADPALKQSYEETITSFEKARAGKLWFPYLGSGFGKGALVELCDGSIKYDFISGIGVHLGHNQKEIVSACIDAALSDIVMQGNLMQNIELKELSDLFLKISKMDHVYFSTSGAMACENALKIIFQKKNPATRLFAFEHCFMGRTLALAQITDKPAYREGLPLNLSVDYLPFSIDAIDLMKEQLKRYPKQHAALCIELIQGEGGFNVAEKAFILPLVACAKEHNIAVLVDEVQSFGRGPTLLATDYFGIKPDVITVGKITQICATLFTKEMEPLPGLLSQTFTGSTSAIFAAKVIVESLLKESQKRMEFSEYLVGKLKEIKGIEGPYGFGTMVCFSPFKGEKQSVINFGKALFDAGLITFITGENPTRIRMLLPMGSLTHADIDGAVAIIKDVLCRSS